MRSGHLLTTALALALAGPGMAAAQQQGGQQQQTQMRQGQPAGEAQGGQQMQQAYSEFEGAFAELEQAGEAELEQMAARILASLEGLEAGVQGAPNAREARVEYQQAREALTALREEPSAEARDLAVRELRDLDRVLIVLVETEETTASAAGATGGGTGARIQVEQAQPQVQVQQPAPEVAVQQPQPQVQVEQRAPQVSVQQPQPQVQVTQPRPEVTVQQPRPEVTVQQAQPQVTVQQPRPEVTVQQAQPEVQVEQAQPRVTVERQGRPQVTVQRQGEAQVEVERQQAARGAQAERETETAAVVAPVDEVGTGAEREATMQREARVGEPSAVVVQPERGAAAVGPAMPAGVQAEQIIGRDVYGPTGDEIGEVNDLLMDPRSGEIREVIIAYGGFLGLGERLVSVPWSEVQFSADGESIIAPMTEDQLESAQAWDDVDNPNLLRGR